CDGATVVVSTRHRPLMEPKPVIGELKRQAKDRRGVTLPPEFGNDDIPDVTACAQQSVVEHVPYRRAPDNSFAVESKQERGGNVIRRKIHTSLPLVEDLQIHTEGHALLALV